MSLVDSHIELVLRYTWIDQECENVFKYFTEGAVFVGVNAVQVAEAWWDDVKGVIRSLAPGGTGLLKFTSVVCRNLVDGGELGEFAIPVGEQDGTRTIAGAGEYLPAFNSGGLRLTVGNTTTRPGQKRFPFLSNVDVVGNALTATYATLLDAVGAHIDQPLTLGSPVVAGVLQPVIGGTVVAGFPTVYQDVIGHVTNPYVTSQVSRKRGRGR
jgi:hypothetical protein